MDSSTREGDRMIVQPGGTEFRFESEPFMVEDIGGPHTMINILSQLDYPDLMEMCNTNEEINKICQMDDLWRTKLLIDFEFNISTDKSPKQIYEEIYHARRNTNGANYAAAHGQLEVLEWLSNLDPKIIPDNLGAMFAAKNGHLSVLKKLYEINPRNFPVDVVSSEASSSGYLDILKWLYNIGELDSRILLHMNVTEGVIRSGHLHILQWIKELYPQFHLPKIDIELATVNGSLNILKWVYQQNPQILNSQRYPSLAVKHGENRNS